MEGKSEIMTLPVLMKDEKKYSDCVDLLDQLEVWTHEIYKASGVCRNLQALSDADDLVEVANRPDQPRAHIPLTSSDEDPLKGQLYVKNRRKPTFWQCWTSSWGNIYPWKSQHAVKTWMMMTVVMMTEY